MFYRKVMGIEFFFTTIRAIIAIKSCIAVNAVHCLKICRRQNCAKYYYTTSPALRRMFSALRMSLTTEANEIA
jgi:hypothetical protein